MCVCVCEREHIYNNNNEQVRLVYLILFCFGFLKITSYQGYFLIVAAVKFQIVVIRKVLRIELYVNKQL